MISRRSLTVFLILVCLIIFPWRSFRSETKENLAKKNSFPTLIRVVYLFLCENQAEVDSYSQSFPSLTADAIFYCWRENCHSSRFRQVKKIFVHQWSDDERRNRTWISFQLMKSLTSVQPEIYIINENQLMLKEKSSWTTARNELYKFALNQEMKQSWRWAFYVFADGDVHSACPLADQLVNDRLIVDYGHNEELLFENQFRTLINMTTLTNDEEKCFLLFDVFLLSISPAVATVSGTSGPMAFPGLLSQVVYHIDAMFNAIHRDALQFLLPYCPRYDRRTWWTSQAIFVYRSLCLYGHVLQFDGVHIVRQNHRIYPRVGDPWAIDNDMDLVPNFLLRLKDYMKQSRFVSPLVLHHYAGWNLKVTSETCRRYHTAVKPETCQVYGENSLSNKS